MGIYEHNVIKITITIIIIIITVIFIVLSSLQSHCKNSLGSRDEYRMVPGSVPVNF